MTDAQQAPRQFVLQRIYLKDVSFESPRAPHVFLHSDWQPSINVQVENASTQLGEDVYEVALTITASATIEIEGKAETVFLAEVTQAGIFGITGFEGAELGHILGSVCPTQLFPFSRETIADLVAKGGFPSLMLQPINFDTLYMQHMQQQVENAASTTTH
jgi:preprotein translocase subunit SecB